MTTEKEEQKFLEEDLEKQNTFISALEKILLAFPLREKEVDGEQSLEFEELSEEKNNN